MTSLLKAYLFRRAIRKVDLTGLIERQIMEAGEYVRRLSELKTNEQFLPVMRATLLSRLGLALRRAVTGHTIMEREAAAAEARGLMSVSDALGILPGGKNSLALQKQIE